MNPRIVGLSSQHYHTNLPGDFNRSCEVFCMPGLAGGTPEAPFGFTGEMTDTNDGSIGTKLLYLRARYYNPALGVFPSLDPFEGAMGRPPPKAEG